MRLITNDCIDRFFQYIPHISNPFKLQSKRYDIGDFSYYDCDEIMERLKPKQKKYFKEYLERNPMQIHEYKQ